MCYFGQDDQEKKIQITKSNDPIALKIKIFRPTHNPILLNHENIDPFLPFSIGDLKFSHKPTKPYYTFK
jgi:hypothetical protein